MIHCILLHSFPFHKSHRVYKTDSKRLPLPLPLPSCFVLQINFLLSFQNWHNVYIWNEGFSLFEQYKVKTFAHSFLLSNVFPFLFETVNSNWNCIRSLCSLSSKNSQNKRMSACIQICYIWVDLFKWNIYMQLLVLQNVYGTQLPDQSNQFGENDNIMRSYSYFFSHKMLKLVCDCVIFHCFVFVFCAVFCSCYCGVCFIFIHFTTYFSSILNSFPVDVCVFGICSFTFSLLFCVLLLALYAYRDSNDNS